ncbi:MAG: hypothetical protein JJ899_09515 [Alphaproteobacteria bacterium]|nr:hypothetical protein [Alphaproteobacteria bacterium]
MPGDQGERYATFFEDGELDRTRVETSFSDVAGQLRDVRVIFVPSYLSDTAVPSVSLGNSLGYMAGIFNWLEDEGFRADIAAVETEDTVVGNAARLRTVIGTTQEPLCFVTHSKGGLDVLEYLRTATREERGRVRCWIAMQVPFSGSPVADLATEISGLPETADALLRALGGRGESLDDLTTATRERYISDHRDELREIFSLISPVCLATHVPDPGTFERPTSWSYPALVWMQENGVPSDGLVPVRSALRMCTRTLLLEGIDHTGIVSPGVVAPIDQEALMKALFVLALDRSAQ